MDLLSWTAAAYILFLPQSYSLETQSVERVEGPAGMGAVLETVCVWKNAANESVIFQWWKPFPPRPGGPMVAARELSGSWAGAPASFIETSMFNGIRQRVSVAFQELSRLDGRARISATGLELEALQNLLSMSKMRDLTSDQAATAGCGATQFN